MESLSNISIDKIETNVMSVLYSNLDIEFTKNSLFNLLLEEKYSNLYSNYIHPNFKSKFLLVIKNLSLKYDNIKIKEENNTFTIKCESNDEYQEYKQNKMEPLFIKNVINLDNSDILEMQNYIFENNLTEYIEYTNPLTGNSIYHEMVLMTNNNLIKKLIDEDMFNYWIENNNKQKPFELSNSLIISNIINNGLHKNFIKMFDEINEQISLLKNKTNLNNSTNNITNYIWSFFDFKKINIKFYISLFDYLARFFVIFSILTLIYYFITKIYY